LARPTELSTYWRDETFDLILVSPQMPDMAGSEVVRQLREQGHAVPIIAMTDTHSDSRPANGRDTERDEEPDGDVGGYVLPALIALGLRKGLPRQPR
jgi:CheY-like chemotaxis protein